MPLQPQADTKEAHAAPGRSPSAESEASAVSIKDNPRAGQQQHASARLAQLSETLTTDTFSSTAHQMAVPQTMKAIKTPAQGKTEVQEVPVPQVKEDFILVKVKYVALNPTDWSVAVVHYPSRNYCIDCRQETHRLHPHPQLYRRLRLHGHGRLLRPQRPRRLAAR